MLNISSNRISSFDYAQIPLGLQWLDLHSNKIDKLNNFYYSTTAQQQLNLASDQQQQQNSIGQQWQSMLRLTTLDASFNLIRELDNTSLPESLETVQLNNNQIRNIASHTFSTKSNLTRINLSNNQLSTMPYEALMLHGNVAANSPSMNSNRDIQQQQQKFVDIYLANNPYLCNCNMGWLSQLLLASSTMLPSAAGSISSGSISSGNLLREHQLILSRQLPRVADAHLVTCHLPLARQPPLINMDPHQWSPVMAANQLAQHHSHHALHMRSEPSSIGSVPLIVKQSELLSSVHLCPYKSHCFAMCFCCDFDACDCEMSCPENCSCYYGQNWSTNIVDCSANNQMQSSSHAAANLSRSASASSSSHLFIHRPTQPVKFFNIPDKIPMDVTELFLDGLELHHLRGNALIGRRNLKSLYLNNSQVQSIEPKAFATQKSLKILQLNSNFLTELFGYEFEQQVELRELYLAHNQLTSIANNTFAPLRSLQILHLQNNQLYHLNFLSNFPVGHRLVAVNLGTNPWSCQCDHVEPMLKWLRANSKHLHDRKSISCQYNRTQALHLMSPLMTSAAMVGDFDDSLMAYESSSGENYPMFDVRMCLNHTVYPIIVPAAPIMPINTAEPARGPADPLDGSMPFPRQRDPFQMEDQMDQNDERSRPAINSNQFNGIGSSIVDQFSQPSPSRYDPSSTTNGYQLPPPPQAASKTSGLLGTSSFLLGAISMTLILVVVILSLVHYRRSMSLWFYSRYGLNMFSAHTKASHHHHHHAVGSLGKHSALHHPHLQHHHQHHHHSQYGASSSAGSTSSSSAASSNLSQALCQQQQQQQNAAVAAAASGLVTTPLIVTSSNTTNSSHQLLNSTATTTTAASAAAACSPYNDDEKLFDAYLTYSRADEQFINDNIAPELEYGQPSYR